MPIKASVKWNKENYDIEIDSSAGIEQLQATLFSLTNVLPDRQKLTYKGKFVKDDASLQNIQDGAKLILIGSADALPAKPASKIVFEEDLSDREKMQMTPEEHLSAGLVNLGNTCYMNSTLQCFRAIPELKQKLEEFANKPQTQNDPNALLTVQLGKLFKYLDSSTESYTPSIFTHAFRTAFPQFAERSRSEDGAMGGYAQQDADECFSQLMSAMAQKLTDEQQLNNPWATGFSNDSQGQNFIDELFGGKFRTITKNKEAPEEIRETTESFRKLRCVIDASVNFLSDGIKKDLNEELEKRSEKLGRPAVFQRSSRISALPKNLVVQFVRFFWKQDTQQKAKIVKKVEFPLRFDISEFCDDSLRKSILVARRLLKQEEDERMSLTGLRDKSRMAQLRLEAALKEKAERDAKRKTEQEAEKKSSRKNSKAMVDVPSEENPKKKEDDPKFIEQQKLKAEKAAQLAAYNAAPLQLVESSGYYELFAVITHQGRSADSGHYISFAKQNLSETDKTNSKWFKYDDDKVSVVNDDEIKKLVGGGDWHTAYLLIYKRIDDFRNRSLEELKQFSNKSVEDMTDSNSSAQ